MRTITPDIFSDEFIGQQSYSDQLIWLGLIVTCADDQGRLIDNPALIRSQVFPYKDDPQSSSASIEACLVRLEHAGKILRYGAGENGSGKRLIQIVNWWRYQNCASWMAASKFPSPSGWTDRCRYHTRGNQIV